MKFLPPRGLSIESIQTELEKITASPVFTNSERMRRFLRFTVGQVFEDKADYLKESSIGTNVFDRPPSFDPRTDSVARVEARRLRSKLAEYYAMDGRDDAVEIQFAKGSYVPTFRHRQPAPEHSQSERRSIAVLPFLNLSPDPENEYFSDGLTEELITVLAQVEGLRVVARTSSFQFRGQGVDARKIGEQLKVGALLEGSVRKSGNKVRISVQLVNAADAYHLWAHVYERALEDVFTVQEEIARNVAENMKAQLTSETAQRIASRAASNRIGYEFYLKGRYFWNQRSPEGLRKSLDYFGRAIAEDRNYAAAYAGLADCYLFLGTYVVAAHEVMPKAKAAALQALTIEETLAEGHAAIGAVSAIYDWDWRGAQREFSRAIELNPGYITAHTSYAYCLAALGRTDEALAQIVQAHELDPISPLINSLLGMFLYLDRQYQAAIEQLQETEELDPGFYRTYWGLGHVYLAIGRLEEAIAALQKCADLSGANPTALGPLGQCYAQYGQRSEAERILDLLRKRSENEYVSAVQIAFIYTGLGNFDEALAWLDRAIGERDPFVISIDIWPNLDTLRMDPRFADLVRKMGLEPRRPAMRRNGRPS